MNFLYLLEQQDCTGWGSVPNCVVVAENEYQAQTIHPYFDSTKPEFSSIKVWEKHPVWADKPENVKVTLLGTARPGLEVSVISSSGGEC